MFRALGRRFWLAGAYGSAGQLCEALELGAAGIQVGTAFAFCDESGLRADLKRQVLDLARQGAIELVSGSVRLSKSTVVMPRAPSRLASSNPTGPAPTIRTSLADGLGVGAR